MIAEVTMGTRPPGIRTRKIRIEKPEIYSVSTALKKKNLQPVKLGIFYRFLLFLSYCFSVASLFIFLQSGTF